VHSTLIVWGQNDNNDDLHLASGPALKDDIPDQQTLQPRRRMSQPCLPHWRLQMQLLRRLSLTTQAQHGSGVAGCFALVSAAP
jgi:hypothetical protein